MKNKHLSYEEIQINKMIESGEIQPIHIPRVITATDILKYQLCSEIIKFKKDNELLQNDIALAINVNKSEISKIFSYQLDEFSTERLLGMLENLIKGGAEIRLESVFEEVRKKVADLDKKLRNKKKPQKIIPRNQL